MDIYGTRVVITGASRGIGRELARGFAAAGADVALVARSTAPLEQLAQELDGRAYAADLTERDDLRGLIERIESDGPVDILVNNAAAAFYLPTADFPLKRRRLSFELNVHAPLDLAQAVLPGMRSRRRGWIVNVSSATSKHPKGPPFDPGIALGGTTTIYGASKAALERVTTGLAAEVYDDGIAVNSLAPVAAVRTPGAEAHIGDVMDAHPEIVEPVEIIAEGALALATCDPAKLTGRILYSGPLLTELGRPVRSLDGTEVVAT
jgi:citronellol/citronellal dehydrogenase